MALFELLAKIKLDGAEAAVKGLENVRSAAHAGAEALSSRLGSATRQAGSNLLAAAGHAGALSAALAGGTAAGAFAAAAKMDSLTIALASVSKNSADLQGQLTRLREVAKLPGLGFEEAVAGSVALQAAGYSAQLAERSLGAFGNALASAGKGKADLEGVSLALQQIASKGVISAEEINQLRERVPQIGRAMQDAFGTSSAEAIQKMGINATQFVSGVVRELEKLPRLTSGIQNSMENLGMAVKDALLPLGRGFADMLLGGGSSTESLLAQFKKLGTQIGEVFSGIGRSGVLDEVGKSFVDRFSKIFGGGSGMQQAIARFAGVTLSILKNIPDTIQQIGEYLSSLFGAIWGNLKSIAAWGISSIQAIFGGGGSAPAEAGGGQKLMKGGLGGDLLGIALKTLGYTPGNQISQGIGGLIAKQFGLSNIDGLGSLSRLASGLTSVPQFPQLQGLPSLSGALSRMTNPLQDADRFTSQILASMRPYSEIPDGLPYGGGAGGGMSGSAGGIFAQWDKNLAEIERNTKNTADALDTRRVFGGAELTNVGITDQERFAIRRPDPYTRSVDASLRSAIHRVVRADQRGTLRRSALYSG